MSDTSDTAFRTPAALRRSPAHALQAAALFVGSAAAGWWSTHVPEKQAVRELGLPLEEADHAFEPWPVPDGAVTAVGVAGLLVALVAAALLVRALATGRLRRLPGIAILLSAPLPLMLGAWWGIATAPVIGANIGVGLAAFLFVPVGLILLAASVTLLLVDRLRRPRTP
ncbi:hypothetical protein [Nocardiopsis ganjiahuensis]|uniref:hypothetical protein n=1 Tax=Nocardiopsis ganjiahuensis TaxID=239984 RepID=UPI00034C0E3B|nr:hypothetical protein [Nocardiopsis ganjiahuensis]